MLFLISPRNRRIVFESADALQANIFRRHLPVAGLVSKRSQSAIASINIRGRVTFLVRHPFPEC
jgi:hypothetical protein